MRGSTGKRIGLFLFVWLMVGFALGTLVLVGVVPPLTRLMRGAGWAQGQEDVAMWAIILVYVVGSFVLARVLTRWMGRSGHPAVRFGVPAAATALAAVALWGWMNPAVYAGAAGTEGGRVETASGTEFVFGAYPDGEKLEALKAQGFTGVVSLQHPAVVPFEPQGIKAEREAAARIGIPLIHAPMLPWVSDNEGSMEKIQALARGGEGKYYVHCGLGRDRVNVVKRMLQRQGAGRLADEGDTEQARSFGVRERPLERGWHEEIARDVWLVPYPNEHEFFGNMFAGQVEQVALLLDPADAEQRAWVDHTRALMAEYDLPLVELPLGASGSSAEAVARRVARLPRPVVVIVPFTHPRADTAVAATFKSAWRRLPGLEPGPSDRPATVARRDSLGLR